MIRCSSTDEGDKAYKILDEKLEGSRPLGRFKFRWEDSIKMDLKSGGRVSTGVVCLRIGTNGGFLLYVCVWGRVVYRLSDY
jgi:hypothetical protein